MLQITPAERAALQLLADGRANREIAERLRVAECEVDALLTALFTRMGGSSRAEAIANASRRGLITIGAETSVVGSAGRPHDFRAAETGPVEPLLRVVRGGL